MVASMHTARNATQPKGSAIAQQARTPVPKKPMKNLIFMPCTSAMEPRIGISSAMMRDAMVCM